MRGIGSVVVALGLVSALTAPANGGSFFFKDRGAFRASTSGLQTIDFEGLVPAGKSSQPLPSLTVNGISFQIPIVGDTLHLVDSAYAPPFYDWGSGAVLSITGSPNELRVTLPEGTTAAGIDVMTVGPYGQRVSMLLPDGASWDVWPPGHPNRGFVGFESTDPVPYFTLRTERATGTVVDNLAFGSAGPGMIGAPEPANLVYLVSAGLVAFGWRGWRKAASFFLARVVPAR